MLNASRLYSFLDNERGFTIYFLEGQKLIHDLALLHDLKGEGFHFLRDTVLSSVQLINYLKPGESLGFYIDSEEPYFRFKIEANYTGKMRTLLLPAEFNEFPKTLKGKIRTVKMQVGEKTPYTSIINADDLETEGIVNKVIDESYQVTAKNILANDSDQCILVAKLPPLDIKKQVIEDIPLSEYLLSTQVKFKEIFSKAFNDVEMIVQSFEELGMSYLGSKQIELDCPCSKDQMITSIMKLAVNDVSALFEDGDSFEVKCDYCKTYYDITKQDIKDFSI